MNTTVFKRPTFSVQHFGDVQVLLGHLERGVQVADGVVLPGRGERGEKQGQGLRGRDTEEEPKPTLTFLWFRRSDCVPTHRDRDGHVTAQREPRSYHL